MDRYDDRDLVRTNLIDSYDRIRDFIRKHLPESHRRDELKPARSKQLHRFIKRMRKAGYDLKDIL